VGYISALGEDAHGAMLLHLSGISLAISDSACATGLAAMALTREAGVTVSASIPTCGASCGRWCAPAP
jgi:sugar/nucleoside kinase (ribokinase family)